MYLTFMKIALMATEVADALVALYEMGPEKRAEMGLAGREYTKKEFNFETFVDRWDTLFSEIYEEKGSWETRQGYKRYEVREF